MIHVLMNELMNNIHTVLTMNTMLSVDELQINKSDFLKC